MLLFSLLLLCHFPFASLIKCINNYRIAPKPMKIPLTIVKCPSTYICFQGESVFDGSYENVNVDTRGCMSRKRVKELLTDDRLGGLIRAPEEIESILESSSFNLRISFEYIDYSFCTSDFCNSSASTSIFCSLLLLLLLFH
ncbi:hypothetical protein PMAYCL1PPCAC_29722 [Pristionchus mayeri]|uniref:Uncharacterized protein n=1 Tax=Pristionchus mayeri TaxID=1317129 RepID=A0AAN5DC99_9BILA|nr:hypothetical protein PMAYCL1PPCAC_29722 [Pristionchus mayeri]